QAQVETRPARKPTRPVLAPGSRPSGRLEPVAPSAEAELIAARTAPGALDALPPEQPAPAVVPAVAPAARETVTAKKPETEAPKIQRLVPVSPEEELDSHFGGLTTRIGRWLETLSLKRAR
ncbi:MAG TPA: hypothetical protein VF107_13035, partial [Burkholderiaceae bacterium]